MLDLLNPQNGIMGRMEKLVEAFEKIAAGMEREVELLESIDRRLARAEEK